MGKIVNALKIARGELPELILRSLDGPDKSGPFNDARPETGKLVEPAAGPVQPLPRRTSEDQQQARAGGVESGVGAGVPGNGVPARATLIEPVAEAWPVMRVQPLLLRVSDSTPLLASQPEQPHAAEQYRIVRTRILQHPSGPSLLVVSSPSMGDGKTVTAVNLAAAFAMKSEEQILLIDADLRRSAVHSYLRVPRAPGLAEVLAGTCRPQDAIFRVGQIPSLHVLPAGEPAANPTELLGSSRWLALVNTVRQHFRRVIVDSPPVEVVADYDLIAAACDSVVLVIRPGCTNRTLCLRALEKTKTKLRGALINGAADGGLSKRYLSHYYSHSRQEEGKD